MAESGERPSAIITRAHGRAGPPGEHPPDVARAEAELAAREPRQKRQQRARPLVTVDATHNVAADYVTEEEKRELSGELPHWAHTLADLKQQKELIDTAIAAIEALYR